MTRSVRTVAHGHSFLEAPRWRQGRLFVSDFFTRRVLAFTEDGAASVVCTLPDDQPSGLGWAPDGSLLVVSMINRSLMRTTEGGFERVADLSGLATWHCNDMVVDDRGRAYVGHFGWDEAADPTLSQASLLRVDPGGSPVVAAEDLIFPNGVAITPDGGTLLVAETFAARITAFDRAADGSLGNRRTWASFAPDPAAPNPFKTTVEACAAKVPLPDGIALDAEGALWIGDAAGSAALRVAEGGAILEAVDTGDQAAFAIALGGEDRRTLYICAAVPYGRGDPQAVYEARLLSCRVDVPGAGLP